MTDHTETTPIQDPYLRHQDSGQALSGLGVLERYQRQVEEQGFGAYCPPEIQDRNYQGVLESATLIDTGDIRADVVHVYRRGGGEPLYTNHRDERGAWMEPPAARQTIITERERSWSATESSWFTSKAENLAERLATPYVPDLHATVNRADPLLQPTDRPAARDLAARLAHRVGPSPAGGAEERVPLAQRLTEIRDRLGTSPPPARSPPDVDHLQARREHPDPAPGAGPDSGPDRSPG